MQRDEINSEIPLKTKLIYDVSELRGYPASVYDVAYHQLILWKMFQFLSEKLRCFIDVRCGQFML